VQSFDDVGAHSMALALVACSMAALIAVFSTSRSRRPSTH
jgi:hypothetical protein